MPTPIRFLFRGRFDPLSFKAFAIHRAARLGLGLTLGCCGSETCEASVKGQGALVDAFEMAMSLGPVDCLVRQIERHEGVAREPVA